MKTREIELINDFHNTAAMVRPKLDARGRLILSSRQVRRAEKKLCGMGDCFCSGDGGVRGGRYHLESLTGDPAGDYKIIESY